jgi:hypothetical protein
MQAELSQTFRESGAIMFNFLFGPKNPTKDWQRDSSLRLAFDLESGKLNGIGFGERLDRMSLLGPAEDRSALKSGQCRYLSLGLAVGWEEEEQTIDCFEIIQKDPYVSSCRPFPGICQYRGEHLDLGQLTEVWFAEQIGPPYHRDEDDEEIILFYEFPGREWQVELDLNGTLNRIIVTSRPLMADEQQRDTYGVDRPWPPRE